MTSDVGHALTTLAALVEGNRALGVEASALLLAVPVGTFRQIAARPGFPRPVKIGKRLTYLRSELLEWWEAERGRQNRGKKAA